MQAHTDDGSIAKGVFSSPTKLTNWEVENPCDLFVLRVLSFRLEDQITGTPSFSRMSRKARTVGQTLRSCLSNGPKIVIEPLAMRHCDAPKAAAAEGLQIIPQR